MSRVCLPAILVVSGLLASACAARRAPLEEPHGVWPRSDVVERIVIDQETRTIVRSVGQAGGEMASVRIGFEGVTRVGSVEQSPDTWSVVAWLESGSSLVLHTTNDAGESARMAEYIAAIVGTPVEGEPDPAP